MPHTRRQFLTSLGLGASALAVGGPAALFSSWDSPKIEKIDVHSVVYPVVGSFKFFEVPEGNLTGRTSAVVKITADDGTIGWGESIPSYLWSYETLESVTTTLLAVRGVRVRLSGSA